jgi:DNA replication factor GINS
LARVIKPLISLKNESFSVAKLASSLTKAIPTKDITEDALLAFTIMNEGAQPEPRIEAIQSAYNVGFMAEEVRVSFKRDVHLNIGSVAVDSKEGDMSSLPRWVAKILAEHGAVEIQSNDLSGYVSRAMNRERIARPHDLSGIDVDFYVRVNDYLEGLKERERENLSVSLNTFVASRLEKIVKLAAASPLSTDLESKLAAEERELYILINSASMKFKKGVLKKFG